MIKAFLSFLPLILATATVVVGSFFTSSPDYWNVAPWLIVASIPVCLIVFFIIAVFSRLLSKDR